MTEPGRPSRRVTVMGSGSWGTAFALVLVRTRGAKAAADALRGLVGGLRAYLVFCVTVAVAAPVLGVYTAVPIALALCLATYAVLLRPRRVGYSRRMLRKSVWVSPFGVVEKPERS